VNSSPHDPGSDAAAAPEATAPETESPAPPAPEATAPEAPVPETTAPATPPPPRPVPRPAPPRGPRPGPPRPGPRSATQGPSATGGALADSAVPQTGSGGASPSASWGRVDETGTVYVRTADGERQVGQWPDGDPGEVLQHFARKYDALVLEVELLEQRVKGGTVSPDDATHALKQIRAAVSEAHAVGDLDALEARLADLGSLIDEERQRRRAERARRVEEAHVRKDAIAEEAERLSTSNDWRAGADRMRALLEEWKALPRLEKSADDTLWRRFSSARTAYTRRRKAHFSEMNEKREGARVVKEKLVKEADELSSSTEWGPTSGAYRDLMRRWKEAGPAPKGVDDQLWKRFRAAQDVFFGARDAATAATDAEYAANATKKEALLVEAEALLPVTDLAAAKASFRQIAERWDAAGKVPRERIKELEGRMRKVEHAIRGVEDDAWRRSNPEARARAADTVAQLETSIADLEKKLDAATASGNDKKASEHTAAIEARRSWLDQARKALEEFSA